MAIVTAACGLFAIAFDMGERQMAERIRAAPTCHAPENPAYRKVIDLARMEVRCYHYPQKGKP